MFLMIVLSFSFAPVVRADVVGTLTIGSQSAVYDDVITVPITASIASIQGIQLSVNYPESILKYIGCSSTILVCPTDVASSTNKVNLTWYDVSNFLTLNNANLLSLQFRVLSPDTSSTVLSFTPVEIINNIGTDITGDITFNSGTLTLNPVATLSSIAITTSASKLTYTVGDSIDISGLVVTGIYSDASTKVETVAADNITGFNSSAPATGQVLTITIGGKTTTYLVDIVAPLSSDKNINSFSFSGLGAGAISGTNIAVEVPFGTNVTALTPTIVVSTGASVNPSSGAAQDFTNPVTYTVTAADSSTQIYTVTVTAVANPDAPIITSIATDGLINNAEKNAIHIIGTAEANSLVTVTLANGANSKTGTQQLSGGAINYDIVIDGATALPASLADGTINVSATATNSVGGVSTSATATASQDAVTPTVTKLGDDSVDIVLPIGATDLVFSEELSAASKTAVQNALTAGADKILTYAWPGATLTITAAEATTFANDVIVSSVSDLAGNTSFNSLIIDSGLTAAQITPDNTGAATVNNTIPQVVITNPTQATTITISSGTTDPKIDVSSFITNGAGTLPAITITSANASNINLVIPASTTITSADTTWNGIIAAPTVTTVTLPETSGQTKTLSTAIEVGFTGAKLSFNKAVRILLPGQAGKRAGYIRTGISFTEITNTCAADNQATGDTLAADGDCKINAGADLVIWTKHFTSFATYTQTATPAPTPAPSSGGGGGGASAPTDTSAPTNISVVINNGVATTTSKTVTLTLSASDFSSIQMMISNDSSFSGVVWENYSTTKQWQLSGENGIKTVYVKFKDAYNNISSVVSDSISLNTSGIAEAPKVEPQVLGEKITNAFTDFIKAQKSMIKKIDKVLTQRLAGKILLQVQDHGEAWYVDSVSQNRFYLADGVKAYGALRKFGLGITNKDLAKIPVGIEKRFLDTDTDADGLADKLEEGLGTDKNKKDTDGDGVSDYDEVMKNKTNPLGAGKLVYDNKLLGRLKGRIVLQIESRGEAWYINPADGKRYYMKDGGAAYQIMRFLSLGITNENIRKINIGD